jgi:hypothetical protein
MRLKQIDEFISIRFRNKNATRIRSWNLDRGREEYKSTDNCSSVEYCLLLSFPLAVPIVHETTQNKSRSLCSLLLTLSYFPRRSKPSHGYFELDIVHIAISDQHNSPLSAFPAHTPTRTLRTHPQRLGRVYVRRSDLPVALSTSVSFLQTSRSQTLVANDSNSLYVTTRYTCRLCSPLSFEGIVRRSRRGGSQGELRLPHLNGV